jgi:hypothetical protein
MKRKLLLILSVAAIVGASSLLNQLSSRPEGAPAAVAADPSSGFTNCTDCHSGTPTAVSNWITTNIPASGYTPGQTYLITATCTSVGRTIFGFQISPQNATGTLKGTLQLISTATTKLVGSSKYITHTTGGNSGTNSRSWTFNWIAPAAGNGAVTFYGSFLGGNNNGSSSGDLTYTTSTTVNEALPCTVTATIVSSSDTICPQDSAILTASGGASYLWSTGATTTSIKVPAGTYTVTATALAGCTASKSKTIISRAKSFPTGITTTNVFGATAKINWLKTTCATGYRIRYRPVGTTTWKFSVVGDTNTKTISALTALTNYEYQVSSLFGTLTSTYGTLKTFTTLCNCPVPTVTPTIVSNVKVNFSWIDESCSIRHTVQYRKLGATAWITKNVGDSVTSLTAGGLTPNTVYQFRSKVDCNTAATFNSGYSAISTFTTPLRVGSTNSVETLNCYPNPSNGQFTLSIPETGKLKVYNMLMQEVYNQNITNNENTINLNLQDLPNGLYLLELTSNDQKYLSKIEIQK